MRATYQMGAMMFDKQFERAEQIVDKAAGSVQGVKGALIANAVVTGLSTFVLVRSAFAMRRRQARTSQR
jgi:hypothetical protein